MTYYPLSQIQTNLFTNGGEFYIPTSDIDIRYYSDSNMDSYTGFYWKTSSKKYFTGKNPQDNNNPIELKKYIDKSSGVDLFTPFSTPKSSPTSSNFMSIFIVGGDADNYPSNITDSDNVYSYANIKNIKIDKKVLLPSYIFPIVTDQNYQQGYFTRYFCKKTNEFAYLEIDKDTYDKLKKKDPAILYQLYKPFELKWQLTGNKEIVYKTNKNLVDTVIQDQKMYNLNKYLKENYTRFWKSN